MEHYGFLGKIRMIGQPFTYVKRRLMAVPNVHPALWTDFHNARSRLDKTLMHHLGMKGIFEDVIRLAKAFLDVSLV